LLAEPSARRTGGEGCPNYLAVPSETCIDESERVAWCQQKLNFYYPGESCAAASPGSEHVCGSNNINCKVSAS
jgi:hypothetical protein